MHFSELQVLVLKRDLHVISLGSVTRDSVDVTVLDPSDKSATLAAGVDLGSVDPGLAAVVETVVDENQVDVVCGT